MSRNLEGVAHDDPPEPVARYGKSGQRGMPLHPGGPDGEPHRELSPAAHLDRPWKHPRHARAHPNLDALAVQPTLRALGQRGMNAAQDLVAGLDDHQAIVAWLDPRSEEHTSELQSQSN